jgi:MOSC domain-containing protein YiiM
MRVISTNTGISRDIEWNGKTVTTGIFKFQVNNPIYLGNEDVENDSVIDRRYHGGFDKACYLYSVDHYDYWKTLYPDLNLPWGIFGENLTIEGLNEAEINIGDIFKIGEAVVQVTQPRQPCFKLEFRFPNQQIVQQFIASGFSGVYVRVLKNGFIKTDDAMQLVERKNSISIHEVFRLLYTENFDRTAVEKAVKDPFIAESCRKDLLKRWSSNL